MVQLLCVARHTKGNKSKHCPVIFRLWYHLQLKSTFALKVCCHFVKTDFFFFLFGRMKAIECAPNCHYKHSFAKKIKLLHQAIQNLILPFGRKQGFASDMSTFRCLKPKLCMQRCPFENYKLDLNKSSIPLLGLA